MMSFEKNPYSWKEENITGTVGSVSLTRTNGSVISVQNLPEEIEVMFLLEMVLAYSLRQPLCIVQPHVFSGFSDFPTEA